MNEQARSGPFGGKVIALTGAGSGIGRALAIDLSRRGAVLALADKDGEGLAATRAMLGNAAASATVLDVSDTAVLAAWIDGAAAEFGALDGIVNNAGLTVVAPFGETSRSDFDRVMTVNFGAVVEGCRAALPHLKRAAAAGGDAWLVNVSSVFGMMGYPTQSAYNASKFAVRGLTEALHIELGMTDPGISVIRVHPGGVKTNVVRNAKRVAGMPGGAGVPASAEAAHAEFERNARSTPEQAAATIVEGMMKKRHRVLIGRDARMIDWMTRLFPVTYFKRIGRIFGNGPSS